MVIRRMNTVLVKHNKILFGIFSFVIIISYAVRGSAGFGGVTVPLLAWIMSLKIIVPMVTCGLYSG